MAYFVAREGVHHEGSLWVAYVAGKRVAWAEDESAVRMAYAAEVGMAPPEKEAS